MRQFIGLLLIVLCFSTIDSTAQDTSEVYAIPEETQIRFMAYSPDGHYLHVETTTTHYIYDSANLTVSLMQIEKDRGVLTDSPNSAVFVDDRFIYLTQDAVIMLDLITGTEIFRFQDDVFTELPPNTIRANAEGDIFEITTGTQFPGPVFMIDAMTGAGRLIPGSPFASDYILRDDDVLLAHDGQLISLTVETETLLTAFLPEDDGVAPVGVQNVSTDMYLSPAGETVVGHTEDGTMFIADADGTQIATFQQSGDIDFSNTGRYIAYFANNTTAILDSETGNRVLSYEGGQYTFFNETDTAIYYREGQAWYLQNLVTAQSAIIDEAGNFSHTQLAHNRLVISNDETITIWDMDTVEQMSVWQLQDDIGVLRTTTSEGNIQTTCNHYFTDTIDLQSDRGIITIYCREDLVDDQGFVIGNVIDAFSHRFVVIDLITGDTIATLGANSNTIVLTPLQDAIIVGEVGQLRYIPLTLP